jgi:hypothetical protein
VTRLSHNDPIHALYPHAQLPSPLQIAAIDSHFPIRYYYSNVTLLLLIGSYFVEFVAESEIGRFMNKVPENSLTLLFKHALS